MLPEKTYKEFIEKFSDKEHITKLIKKYFEEGSGDFKDILSEYREDKLNEIKED